MKGIVLAGGSGTRLLPITLATSKQLLPVYDKPMIYYPISTLMQAEIRNILIITTPQDQHRYKRVLGDGSQWGIEIIYATQSKPNGIAEALIIGENFIGEDSLALILGDNIFLGNQAQRILVPRKNLDGARIFAKPHTNLADYGVVEIDVHGRVLSIEEKPRFPKGGHMIPGLYFFDSKSIEMAKSLKPSSRGELEITDIHKLYLDNGSLEVQVLDDSILWFDAGTPDSLLRASETVRSLQSETSSPIGSPELVAKHVGWI